MSASPALADSLRQAALVVSRVAQGRSLSEQLAQAALPAGPARGALIDLSHGTLRAYGRVQFLSRALSRKRSTDALLEALIWCSLYALDSQRFSPHTVVDQAVRACGLLEKWNAKGYVNAVLRNYLRERDGWQARAGEDEEAAWQHPQWWIDAVRAAYPGRWEDVLRAGNAHPPMCLRVNRRRTSGEAYAARLSASGLAAKRLGPAALLLEQPVPVERLPGFAEGDVSVQDFGAQRAAHALNIDDGMRVLDACAAPGGKTAHLLELAGVQLLALDSDAARCARITANLSRLQLEAQVRVADCTDLPSWWDGHPFERVLADVPCSASGVARRHPDIKWLRRASDVSSFAERQAAILGALWRVLAPGGKLLYVTCSVFPQENEAVVEAFTAKTPGAHRLALPVGGEPGGEVGGESGSASGGPLRGEAQWLPGVEHDGFYHALIQKQA